MRITSEEKSQISAEICKEICKGIFEATHRCFSKSILNKLQKRFQNKCLKELPIIFEVNTWSFFSISIFWKNLYPWMILWCINFGNLWRNLCRLFVLIPRKHHRSFFGKIKKKIREVLSEKIYGTFFEKSLQSMQNFPDDFFFRNVRRKL